jgi:LPXTG-motif cell wall-anchored protein
MFRKILAATAALTLGLGGVLATAAPASATSDDNCRTEKTGWLLEAPDGDGWIQVDQRTVTDKEAWEEVIVISEAVPGKHYVHAHNEGDDPLGNDEVPPTPSEDPSVWQENTHLEPHTQGAATPANNVDGTPYEKGDSGLHYTSHPGNPNDESGEGRRDWFYFQAPVDEVTEIVKHDAVTHKEYKYERTTCDPVDRPANPQVKINAYCGVADVYLSNPVEYGSGYEQEQVGQDDAEFTILVDGVATTDEPITVAAGGNYQDVFFFDEDSGDHTVQVLSGEEVLDSVVVSSDCESPLEITAAKPEFTDPTCELNQAGLNLPDQDGIDYTVSGSVAPGEKVTVIATLAQGSDIATNSVLVGKVVWSHTYGDKATDCGKTPPPDKPEPPATELPHTGGSDIAALLTAGLGLMLLGGLALVASRRRKGMIV